MRAYVLYLLLGSSLCVLVVGCGDDGQGTVTVGDEADAGTGKIDSGSGLDDMLDSGPIIFGGCDAGNPKCMIDSGHSTHHAGSGGSDDGGSGDAG